MESIWNLFQKTAIENPEKTAVICGSESISYGQLKMKCEVFSESLRRKGVTSNTFTGLYIGKSIECVIALFAIFRLGSVAVPLSTYYNLEEIQGAVNATHLPILVTDHKMNRKLNSEAGSDICKIIEIPSWNSISASMLDNTSLTEEVTGENCLILMTSGSTEQPKCTVISQKAMCVRMHMEMIDFTLSKEERVLISTPIYHSLGIRILMTAICYGMQVVLTVGFSPKAWLEQICENRITYTITVPAQIAQILEYAEQARVDAASMMESIRTILSTSAYLPPNQKKTFGRLIHGRFLNFIASSETEFIAWSDCTWEDSEGNMLGIPFPETELMLIQNDQPVNDGEVGEIVCKSDQLFSYYYGDTQRSQSAFWNGYYKTGDLGYFDELGRLHYAGRKKNVIICSGVNIIPRDVEKVLLTCPGVQECVAFGYPNAKNGEVVSVLIVGSGITEKDIKKYALSHLTMYQQPRKIFIVDQIPKNEMGKISMNMIKEQYILKGDKT